jgi:magnesium chelatase family protein
VLAAVRSAAVLGIEAYDVTVEVDAALGLPTWIIVGLAASAVKESRERVSAAVVNSGFALPPRRIVVNLAPADTKKDGTAFDLPIALALLTATGQLAPEATTDLVVVAELGLDGAIRAIRGALPIARRVAHRTPGADPGGGAGPPPDDGALTLVLPPTNVAEAALVPRVQLATAPTLAALVDALRRHELAPARVERPLRPCPAADGVDFADVVGQPVAKRALEVAAAGGHNVLMIGPPGAGKTMLARRMPTILPALTEEEALEVIAVHSVAGELGPDTPLPPPRPFRAPHHTVSGAGLIGGGSVPRPGEVSLAHRGVLFLDELLELPRYVLDALRQPLEEGRVVIARAVGAIAYPARFTLVAATNPCPCGRAGDPRGGCRCPATAIARYRGRVSGPLADRIDIHITIGAVAVRELGTPGAADSSADIRARVEAARSRQRARYRDLPGVTCNAEVAGRWLDARSPVESAARELLSSAAERLALSARGYHRVLRVARSFADLAAEPAVTPPAIAEALRYRPTFDAVHQ